MPGRRRRNRWSCPTAVRHEEVEGQALAVDQYRPEPGHGPGAHLVDGRGAAAVDVVDATEVEVVERK